MGEPESSAASPNSRVDDGAQAALIATRRESLRRVGLTQAELAERIGVSRQSVGLVMANHHRSRRVEQALADAVGLPVVRLFPDETIGQERVGGGAPARTEAPDARAGEASRDAPAATPPSRPAEDVEGRVARELHALGRVTFLALAEGHLSVASPVVRAVAAALRELEAGPDTLGSRGG